MRPSWVTLPSGTPFPIENLPLGAFVRHGERTSHLGIAIGDSVFDLHVASAAGLYDEISGARERLAAAVWNDVFSHGRSFVRRIRERTAELLAPNGRALVVRAGAQSALVPVSEARMVLPIEPGDYVDFYASVTHATRVGRIFRPGESPLPPQYRSLPIGYHGRASSIVVGGTPVVRPIGQSLRNGAVVFAPSEMLDYELELAYFTAGGPALGTPIPVARARDAIVGVALLNDWSARDLQSWEYRPLGPFLGKSFATSLGAWIVTTDAIEGYRTNGPVQEPSPLAHLRDPEPRADDIHCEIALSTIETRAAGAPEIVIARPHASALYWSAAQMLAHLTSNGARVRGGDLFATGTISSGPAEPGDASNEAFEPGSFLERTEGGAKPLARVLANGDQIARKFLEDGDEIVLRAWCGGGEAPRIGFGELRGRIEGARAF